MRYRPLTESKIVPGKSRLDLISRLTDEYADAKQLGDSKTALQKLEAIHHHAEISADFHARNGSLDPIRDRSMDHYDNSLHYQSRGQKIRSKAHARTATILAGAAIKQSGDL